MYEMACIGHSDYGQVAHEMVQFIKIVGTKSMIP
jgi:hypothetical protein